MIYITQLVYLKEGKEDVFLEFEKRAMPIISKYNGRLLLRVRPKSDEIIEKRIDTPYEIHLVEFDSESDFENFKQDDERTKFLHLKEQSVQTTLLIKGAKV